MHRSLLQIGYDQPMNGRGPQAVYAYYYYNRPDIAGTNVALRLAIAPASTWTVNLDSRKCFHRTREYLGVGIYGGAFADNYYDVRQGNYRLGESFDGHGGGAAPQHLPLAQSRTARSIEPDGQNRLSLLHL